MTGTALGRKVRSVSRTQTSCSHSVPAEVSDKEIFIRTHLNHPFGQEGCRVMIDYLNFFPLFLILAFS